MDWLAWVLVTTLIVFPIIMAYFAHQEIRYIMSPEGKRYCEDQARREANRSAFFNY